MTEHTIDKITEILERYGVIITDDLNHEIRGLFINPDVIYKVCRCCQIEVPLTEYDRLPDKKNGDKSYRSLCKICMKIKRHACLLYTSPSPRDRQRSRMPSSA